MANLQKLVEGIERKLIGALSDALEIYINGQDMNEETRALVELAREYSAWNLSNQRLIRALERWTELKEENDE